MRILVIVMLVCLGGCSTMDLGKAGYQAGASHQCYEAAKADPEGPVSSADCPTADKIDGMSYEEYQDARTSKE